LVANKKLVGERTKLSTAPVAGNSAGRLPHLGIGEENRRREGSGFFGFDACGAALWILGPFAQGISQLIPDVPDGLPTNAPGANVSEHAIQGPGSREEHVAHALVRCLGERRPLHVGIVFPSCETRMHQPGIQFRW
jgi:hypothetical protein